MTRLLATILLATLAAHARGTVDYVRTLPSVREFTKPRKLLPKLVNWIAGAPDDKPEITRPYATAHDSTGRLLVADPGQRGIHIFDLEKRKYQFLKGHRSNTLLSPVDVACDSHDNIYVTDSVRALIFVFDPKGRLLRTFGQNLKRPTGMFLDAQNQRIYLTDTLRHQVLVYSLDGALIREIGHRGTLPGEFNYPTALTLANGKLHIVDSMNFRIQTLTPEGQFLTSFGQQGNTSGTLNRPKGIAADTDGNIYIVDALFETVQIFNQSGQLLYYFGASGAKPGQFQLPSGISIDNRNVIYIADSLNRRVQVFHYRRLDP